MVYLFLNYIQLAFLSVILVLILFGSLVNLFEKQLPSFVVQTVRYGKFSDKNVKSALVVQVPKSWFRHFYLYSSSLTAFALYLCINNYVYNENPPQWVYSVLDFTMGSWRTPRGN